MSDKLLVFKHELNKYGSNEHAKLYGEKPERP